MKKQGSRIARRIVMDMEREKRFRENLKREQLREKTKQLENKQNNLKEK